MYVEFCCDEDSNLGKVAEHEFPGTYVWRLHEYFGDLLDLDFIKFVMKVIE